MDMRGNTWNSNRHNQKMTELNMFFNLAAINSFSAMCIIVPDAVQWVKLYTSQPPLIWVHESRIGKEDQD